MSGSFGRSCKEKNAIHILTPKLSFPVVYLFQYSLSHWPPQAWLRERQESSAVFEFCTLRYSLKLCNLPVVQTFASLPNTNAKFFFWGLSWESGQGPEGIWGNLAFSDRPCIPFSFPYREKGTDMFRASVVIPSKDKAAFLLSYEELLQRRLGKYEHIISVRPQQLVGRLMVEVNILERSGIESLEVLPLQHSRQKGSGRGEGECNRRVSCANSERGVGFREIYKTDGTPSTKALRVARI